ncbi:MAG: DHH family phosphoesterase, partial [Chloroflexota bacterium]
RVVADSRGAAPASGRLADRASIGGEASRAAPAAPPEGIRIHRARRAADDAMTVNLEPFLAAVPDAVIDRLRGARRVLAVSHENPDADTLGAALGVVELVEALGGAADPVCNDPIPALYGFLPGVERFRTDPDPAATYDLAVIVDCGSLDRIGALGDRHAELFERTPRLIIDHHASNDGGGEADWIEPHAAATCEMVALLAARLGVAAGAGDGALATNLMAGIVMDTATFAHPNATPRTLTVSAWLVEAGAPLSDISRRLYRSKPEAQLRLFGRILARLESADDGRIVWSNVSEADYAETGADRAHSEGLIDLLSQSDAAEVAILFKEAGPRETRISVRTRPGGVDATVLTGRFGGGGHARAAGATVEAHLAEARPPVLAEASRLVAAVVR